MESRPPQPPSNAFTPALQAYFLHRLSERGNVRLACRQTGISPQTAYLFKRRDPRFAAGWAAANVLAHAYCEAVIADRAIDGIEEKVYYHGEEVGMRRRFDTRLMLAHMARLDAQAQDRQAQRNAARFDELLAMIAGEEYDDALENIGSPPELPLPLDRKAAAEKASADVWLEYEPDEDAEEADFEDAEWVDEAERFEHFLQRSWQAARDGEARYDAWRLRAHGRADGIVAMTPPSLGPLENETLCDVPEAPLMLSGNSVSEPCQMRQPVQVDRSEAERDGRIPGRRRAAFLTGAGANNILTPPP